MKKAAKLYRMKTDEHICPFGLKARSLLQRKGFAVDDQILASRAEADAFKQEYGVETTPQVFIGDKRIGGYDDLRAHFGLRSEKREGVSYRPVFAIFLMAFAMAAAVTSNRGDPLNSWSLLWTFIGMSMSILAIQKLQDLVSFSNQFITYDLLSMRWVPYGYIYPFAEAYAGIGMLARAPGWAVAPVALFIGTVGAVSVFKAVYVDKRELKCACVGGNSKVPLGFVSLTENLFMVFAGLWMLFR